MRRAAKVDDNQEGIVTGLEAIGASVESMAALGAGFPDLLVGFRRVTYVMEVKNPGQPPSKRKLTPAQSVWHSTWRGAPVVVIETLEDAFEAIGYKT